MDNAKARRPTIAAVVMSANEAANIRKCLASLSAVDKVFVLDNGANDDGTSAIAESFTNVRVVKTQWLGFSKTFNSGIVLARDCDWLLRLDADEELVGDIRSVIDQVPAETVGLVLRRRIVFLGEPLRWGPYGKLRNLRLFRPGLGYCEEAIIDEHIVVDGNVDYTPDLVIVDRDLKPFSCWLSKHVQRAKLEAYCTLLQRREPKSRNKEAGRARLDRFNRGKRFLKFNVYYRLPPFVRAFTYFFFRFFIQLECFGGRAGMSWSILQGLWYRLLVDFYLWYPSLIERDTGTADAPARL